MSPALDALLQRGFRYALALCHDATQAEDLVQDAYLSILKRGAPQAAPYLITVIRNRFIDHYRRGKRLTMHALPEHEPPADEPPFSDRVLDRDVLDTALGSLGPAERELIYLAYVEDYTAQELSDMTGRPRNTILSLLHRARHKLRAAIGDDTQHARKEAQS